tara:strand:- start:21538 stop:22464 length:927 start_codon:yes stop_codon:yes gene_type:complete
MYNFKLLQSFISVADTGSFRAAAEKLHRSQSVVSTQVRQLEEQIGLKLFERTTRKTELTEQGKKLLRHLRSALSEIETGLEELRQESLGEVGHIAMACVPSIAGSILPAVLKEFRDIYPKVGLRLVEQTSVALLETVKSRKVDFGIGPFVADEPDLSFTTIAEEPIFAVLPPTFRKENAKSISLADLAGNSVVMASNAAALRGNLDQETSKSGIKIESSFEVTHVQTMLAFARAGLGIALIPASTLPVPPDADLQVLHVTEPPLQRRLCLITAKGAVASKVSSELTRLILGHFQSNPLFVRPTRSIIP